MRQKCAKTIELCAKVAVPVARFSQSYPKDDIDKAEDYFRRMVVTYGSYHDREAESDYDRCRLLVKWAISCNAKLKDLVPAITTANAMYNFTFCFDNLDDLEMFVTKIDINVNGGYSSSF